MIISAVLGSLLGWFDLALPVVIDRPFELLGQTALALGLVSLVHGRGEDDQLTPVLNDDLFAVCTRRCDGIASFRVGGLPAEQTFIVMIFAACPAATASYILTTQIGGDDALAAASIVVSTFLSFVALAVVLVMFSVF